MTNCHLTANRQGLAVCLLLGAGLVSPAKAAPSVLWTPSPEARHALQLLVDEAGLDLTTTHWPLPAQAVQDAIEGLPKQLPPELESSRALLLSDLHGRRSARADIDLATRAQPLPGFGEESTPGSWASIRNEAHETDGFAAQVGLRWEAKPELDRSGADLRADDTTLATEVAGVQLQAWAHRSWWGPGWQNALALSNNAPAFVGVGLQRASASTSPSRWLRWLGPWTFEAFVAQTEDVAHPARPFLYGMRLASRPWSFLEIGLTEMAQWGGEGRPQSVRDFLKIFTRRQDHSYYTAAGAASDASNGLAGFDWRATCPGRWRCSVYGQLIGEDEAGNHLPMKYLGQYGVEHWNASGTQRQFIEFVESACGAPSHRHPSAGCAYRNGSYPEGYTSAGRWIGTSVGPDSHVTTAGWMDVASHWQAKAFYGWIGSRIGNFSPEVVDPRYTGRLTGLEASQALQLGAWQVTPHLAWWQVAAQQGPQHSVAAGVRFSRTWP